MTYKLKFLLVGVALLAVNLSAGAKAAQISEGCQALNQTVSDFGTVDNASSSGFIFPTAKNFHAGEIISFTLTGIAQSNSHIRFSIEIDGPSNVLTQIVYNPAAASARTFSYQQTSSVNKAGAYRLAYSEGDAGLGVPGQLTGVKLRYTCQNPEDVGNVRQQLYKNTLVQAMRHGTTHLHNMMFARIESTYRLADQSTEGRSAGGQLQNGGWVNFSLSHFSNDQTDFDQEGLYGTLMGGLESQMSDDIILGTALNLEKGHIETTGKQAEADFTGIGLSPYMSWNIADRYKISGFGNATYLQARMSDRLINGVISQTEHDFWRWQINLQGAGRWQWENWALYSFVSLEYGALSASDALDVSGNKLDIEPIENGSGAILIKPSYAWTYDPGLTIMPYLLAEYRYDFINEGLLDPVTGFQQDADKDQFRLGAGINILGGDDYSADIEASMVLGREEYTQTQIQSNFRLKF